MMEQSPTPSSEGPKKTFARSGIAQDGGLATPVRSTYCWRPFNPDQCDIQSNICRVRFDGNIPFNTGPELTAYLSHPLTSPFFRPTEFETKYATQPKNQRRFREVYEAYQTSISYRDGMLNDYGKLIGSISDTVASKMSTLPDPPDCLVVIPTCRETGTARATEVILNDLRKHSHRPYAIVLHNDVRAPMQQTLEDLALIREDPSISVLDLLVHPSTTIGELRAMLADTGMEVMHRLNIEVPLIFGDADITGVVREGSYATLLNELISSPTIELTSGLYHSDKENLQEHQLALAIYTMREMFSALKRVYIQSMSYHSIGCFMAITPSFLAALGGVPRIELGEDHILGIKADFIAAPLGPKYVSITTPLTGVYTKIDRTLAAQEESMHLMARYVHFDAISREERPTLASSVIDKELVVHLTSLELDEFLALVESDLHRLDRKTLLSLKAELWAGIRSFCSQWGIALKARTNGSAHAEDTLDVSTAMFELDLFIDSV